MKYLIFVIVFSLSLFSQKGLDLSIRYLKLSNTYREVGDFERSEEFLKKAEKLLDGGSNWNYKYWNAVSYEYSGLLNRDKAKEAKNSERKEFFSKKAYEDIKRAHDEYKRLVNMNDGSQIPTEDLLTSLKSLQKLLGNFDQGSDSRVYNFEKLKLRDLPRGLPDDVNNITLAENKFREIPNGLSDYKELSYINLSDNKIREINTELEELNKLQWLDLSDNKIRKISIEFCSLKSLEELDLSNNKLKSIPTCLCEMQNLKILNLKGNKLPYPEIAKLIKCLQNTNIFIDEYILEESEKN